jgi:hypothetical protein
VDDDLLWIPKTLPPSGFLKHSLPVDSYCCKSLLQIVAKMLQIAVATFCRLLQQKCNKMQQTATKFIKLQQKCNISATNMQQGLQQHATGTATKCNKMQQNATGTATGTATNMQQGLQQGLTKCNKMQQGLQQGLQQMQQGLQQKTRCPETLSVDDLDLDDRFATHTRTQY